MGSSGSKGKGLSCASSSNSSSRKSRRGLSKVHRVFQSSCLPTLSGSFESHDGDRGKENEGDASFSETQTGRGQMKFDGYGKVKLERSAERPYLSADVELDEWDPGSLTHAAPRAGSHSAQPSSAQSLNPSSRFLSRFKRIPGSLSFRLTRATSLGSSSPYPVSSTSLPILDNEDELHLQPGHVRGLISRDETGGHCGMLLSSQLDETPMQCYGDGTADFRLNMREFGISDCTPYDEMITSPHDQATNADFAEARALDLTTCVDNPERTSTNIYSPIINNGSENAESRLSDWQCGSREPIERNSRFSRTLSVGRLRDRVLRRSSLPGSTLYPFQQEREERDGSHISGREARNVEGRASTLESSELTTSTTLGYCPPDLSSSFFSIQDYEVQSLQTTRPRESRYHDLLEHRSNFLERRRRIRSQVRALQRLGSRFENLPEHERSCVLSGQHRSGRCTCHTNNRNSNLNANLNDNTTARASISRIVLLAEALFEVLDEIHQQSVVLSSRPSVSVIGSIPAPNQVVDSLPIKLYSKLHKHQNEEVALCYICLVEYEEGDSMRILPCHHEFHKSCVDKWLKEIHRVCPLCRGDICRSDTTSEN